MYMNKGKCVSHIWYAVLKMLSIVCWVPGAGHYIHIVTMASPSLQPTAGAAAASFREEDNMHM